MIRGSSKTAYVAMSVLIVAVAFGLLARAEPPAGHFTVNADGTVTDNHTGLIWQRSVPSASYSHEGAIGYCEGLSLAGSSAWRLPAVAELQTIVDETRVNPAIDPSVFPSTPSEWFWSSSPYAGAAGRAWGVSFNYGNASNYGVASTSRVRCVR